MPRERSDRWVWIIWVGAPSVAWLAHTLLGLSMAPKDVPTWIWTFGTAPLLEELAFRPLLQRGIQQRIPAWLESVMGAKTLAPPAGHIANFLVGFAFVAAHAPQQGWSAMWWILPSMAIGEVWRRRQRFWPCVLLHAWFNACLTAATLVAAR